MQEKAQKYILYARKSSESEDRQMASIDSQIRELKELAFEYKADIIEILTESKSAKEPGRPIFNQMLAKLRRGEADGILCWKLNRLARNPIDGGEISWLLQKGKVRHILTHGRSYYPDDNVLMMQVELGMANQYVRDLSTDAKRGLTNKAVAGWYPGKAPLGYLHDPYKKKGEKEIINDPIRFEIVRKALKSIASCKYTVPQAYKIATQEWGLTNRKGGRLSISNWYAMLNHPLYYGEFEYPRRSGDWYHGKHHPMITQTEFLKIQSILGRKGTTRPQKYTFSYGGILRCWSCEAGITAEHKTKRNKNGNVHCYVYYHCTKKKDPNCIGKKTVEEKELEKQIKEKIYAIDIPSSFKDWAIRYFKENEAGEEKSDLKVTESQQKAYDGTEEKLSRLLDMRINNELSEIEFATKKEELLREKVRLKELLEKPRQESWIKRFERTMSTAEDIANRFDTGNESKRKQILHNLGSNLYIKSEMFEIEASNPILLMEKFSSPVKEISERFEPLKSGLDKEKLELAYSSSPILLRR
jgi:DNA invertase Pin-like site-specific DNA recombinase